MKLVFFLIVFTGLFYCSPDLEGCEDNLLKNIELQQTISRKELEKCLSYDFSGYEEKFIGEGGLITSGSLRMGIINGIKDTIIYDILIVFKNKQPILLKENPSKSFYRKDGVIYNKYSLGEIYYGYNGADTTCIISYIKKIMPFRIDTLPYEFRIEMGTPKTLDSLVFCNN